MLTEKSILGSPRRPGWLLSDTRLEVDANLPLHASYSIATESVVINEEAVVSVFCDEATNPVGHACTRPGDTGEADAERGLV